MPESNLPSSLYETRDYHPDDFESLVALRARLFKDDFMSLVPWSDEWNREHLKTMLSRCRHRSIVARDELIGFVQWSEYSDQLHLQYLAIVPEYQRLGIGSQLLKQLQSMAQQESMPVTLSLLHNHPGAVAFYQSAGFVVLDTAGRYVRMRWTPKNID